MAAPTLSGQGTINNVTSGNNAPTIPTHAAGDILIVNSIAWHPNTAGDLNPVGAPTDWLEGTGRVAPAAGEINGRFQFFFRRAAASGTTVSFTRPAGWDTGTDGAWGCRAYVITGAGGTTSADWFEFASPTALLTAANGSVLALTGVGGTERLGIHFLYMSDDTPVSAATLSGWTAGTASVSGTGTDCGAQTFRLDNISSDQSAAAMTVSAPAVGGYVAYGFVVIPVVVPAQAKSTVGNFAVPRSYSY